VKGRVGESGALHAPLSHWYRVIAGPALEVVKDEITVGG
jgi:hypothetical protein